MPTMLLEIAANKCPPPSDVLLTAGCASTSVTPAPAGLPTLGVQVREVALPRRQGRKPSQSGLIGRPIPGGYPSSSSLLADAEIGSRPLDSDRWHQAAVRLHTQQPAIWPLEDRRAVARRDQLVVRRQFCWMRMICPVGLRTRGARWSAPTTR